MIIDRESFILLFKIRDVTFNPTSPELTCFISGIPLSLETVIAILIISAAVITYVKNPIKEQTAKPVDESKV